MHLPMSGLLLGLLLLLLAGQLALTLELGLPLTAIGLIVQIDQMNPAGLVVMNCLNMQNAIGHLSQEGLIMGNKENRCRQTSQGPTEPVQRSQVQVIGRLIQEQTVRLQGQGPGQLQLELLAP